MGQVEVMKLLLEEGAVVDHSVDGVHIKHKHKMNICARERERQREQANVCMYVCMHNLFQSNDVMLSTLTTNITL
jgi:hypothetical protein